MPINLKKNIKNMIYMKTPTEKSDSWP